MLRVLTALGSAQRLRIVASLVPGRNYVSQMARDLQISRPLLHLHLQRLEKAGLVRGHLELSEDGKAMKFFEITPFAVSLTPATVAKAVESLSDDEGGEGA
jgi:predicted transcriptional regulator